MQNELNANKTPTAAATSPAAAPRIRARGAIVGIIVHSFIVIPLVIAVFGVSLAASVRLLTLEERDVFQLLDDIQDGGKTRRWQAAFELSQLLSQARRDAALQPAADERFTSALISVFDRATHDPNPQVRQYLALAMGRSGYRDFTPALLSALDRDPPENRPFILHALGVLGNPEAAVEIRPFTDAQNARVRLQAVIALGNLDDQASKPRLQEALKDPESNIRWDAAVALAKLGDSAGTRVLLDLLDADYLATFEAIDAEAQMQIRLTAIRAAALLQVPALDQAVRRLAESDPSMEVRQAAMAASTGEAARGAI